VRIYAVERNIKIKQNVKSKKKKEKAGQANASPAFLLRLFDLLQCSKNACCDGID
jgi:hypothetical protein